jgi:hypothetical protein
MQQFVVVVTLTLIQLVKQFEFVCNQLHSTPLHSTNQSSKQQTPEPRSHCTRPCLAGVSLMFYRMLLSDSFARRFDYMWWMESDVQVLRPAWLDKVYEEAMFPSHFWVKGSMYRGQGCTHSRMSDWLHAAYGVSCH